MAMPFEVFTDHYALQWLKTMRTGSALLHRWSAALEEYDFTVKHRSGKAQNHVDGLSRLPVDPAPPEDVLLHIRLLENEDMKHGNSHKSSTLPLISAGKRYGSSFATGTILSPVAPFAWKSCRVVPSVRWGAIMATARRPQGPYSPEGHRIRSQSILWDLYPPTTDRNSSSCLWIATRGIPSSSPLATTPQTQ